MDDIQKNSIKGSDIFLKILENEDIDILFGNPGTTELPIMNSISKSQIKYVLALQESIVLAIADGYSRSSGKISVCNIHVAPGLGNAMGALYNAKFTNSPILITAGQQERGHGLTEPMLYAPLLPMAQSLVKWAYEIERVEDLPRTVRRAIKIAKTPPTGPVFLSLPGDIMNADTTSYIGRATNIYTNIISENTIIDKIISKIFDSLNPVIIVGDEISTHDALIEASQFSQVIGSAVYQQTVPWGAHFLTESPTFIKALSRNQKEVHNILSQYDLLIVLGGDPLRMSVYRDESPIPDNMSIIHIGLNPNEIGKNYPTEIGIIANLKYTLPLITKLINSKKSDNFIKKVNKRLKNIEALNWINSRDKFLRIIEEKYSNNSNITPDIFISELVSVLPKDVILIDEGLTTTTNLLNLFPLRDPNSYHGLASGGIGWAISAAIGIQLAQTSRPVVAVIGDGSAMYGIQALWTAANLNLPITYIIVNNHSYKILKQRLKSFHNNENYIGMDIQNPFLDFSKIGADFGLTTFKVVLRKHLKETISHAVKLAKPTLIDVEIL